MMTSITDLKSLYNQYKELSLKGRYINLEYITPLLNDKEEFISIETIGYSVNQLPIYGIKIGNGFKKVLMWSQMHGNESTTTKAVFDTLNTLKFEETNQILNECTLYIIPMLNPDGALAYTRLNANEVDLNRDAQNLTQPESKALRAIFDSFQPDFCLNLHGQRTIFSAGKSNNSATLSFLSPAQDKQRGITDNRKRAMELIVAINKQLQFLIPDGVGIYDDAFNINCVGDTFQSLNVPTVLFEAGHISQDYEREQTREYIYYSLMIVLEYISKHKVTGEHYKSYLDIPENGKLFYDIIIRNVTINKGEVKDVAIQYQETLNNRRIDFVPKIINIGELSSFYGHREINAKVDSVKFAQKTQFQLEEEIDSIYLNNELFSLKPVINP